MMVEYKTINDIPAIKTRYKNTMFRSRLEAKWAVFFDECGIKWEHEPKCFNIDGIKYLPDFLLHDVIICFDGKTDLFAEVKGKMTKESIKKIKRFTFGSPETIRKNMHRKLDYWLDIQCEDGLEIPELTFPIVNRLAILGEMPLVKNFDNIKQWLNDTFSNSSIETGRAMYSCRNLFNDIGIDDCKFLPVKTFEGMCIVPDFMLNQLTEEELELTKNAYYTAVTYNFDSN